MQYDADDIFDELASIRDPEKPQFTLAQLNVVARDRCDIVYLPMPSLPHVLDGTLRARRRFQSQAIVRVQLLPTVPHCHLMALICLSVYVRLLDALPVTTSWRFVITLVDGSHLQQEEIEKQIRDKERVAAAMDNPQMMAEIVKLVNPDTLRQ